MGADAAGVSLRLTASGAGSLLTALCALAVGLTAREPMLISLAAALLLLLLASLLLAPAQLRGLSVLRQLPEEIVADQPASGRFLLHNPRRWLGAWQLSAVEVDASAATATVDTLPPGSARALPARWWFVERGVASLSGVRLVSQAPFGLIEASRTLRLPAEVVIYPQPRPGGRARNTHGGAGQEAARVDQRRGSGELSGLRLYQPGDPLRWVHWPTSARVGRPVVIERAAETTRQVIVEVADVEGAAWEQQLSQAAGEIDRQLRQGAAVGLRLSGEVWPPRLDATWRRVLLEQLARAERR